MNRNYYKVLPIITGYNRRFPESDHKTGYFLGCLQEQGGRPMTRKKPDNSRDFIMQIEKDLLRDVGIEQEFTQGLMEEFHAKS